MLLECVGGVAPCHFRPSNENVSACGIECPEYSAYDGRDVDCARCRKTKKWKIYMGLDKQTEEFTIPAAPRQELFAGFDPDELTIMDGYDDCIVGVVERFGQPAIVCYNKEMILQRLESDGMNRDEAEEWFDFNQIGAWVGDATPCFLSAND